MAATVKDFERVADLKFRLRKTDIEVAELFGVSQRTIQRWLRTSQYGEIASKFRVDQMESSRSQLAGLADDIIATLVDEMKNAKSGFVRVQAAQTLGKWMGLEYIQDDKQYDDREEIKELLRMIADNHMAPSLPPPLPGGSLPLLSAAVETVFVDGSYEPTKRNEG